MVVTNTTNELKDDGQIDSFNSLSLLTVKLTPELTVKVTHCLWFKTSNMYYCVAEYPLRLI
jgi:hypothetical protein